jgi:hypothetical protein
MLTINLQNVEELVFYNKALQQALPEFYNTFQTWNLGKRLAALRHLCQKAIFEFFDGLTDEHILKLEEHFKTEVEVVRADPHLVKSGTFDLDCSQCELNEFGGYENWFVCRDADKLYITFWR